MSLSLPHDVLWISPKPWVLPLLGYRTNPNVVLGILPNAKWAVAKCCRKAERLGGSREYRIPPSHKNIKYVFWHGETLCFHASLLQPTAASLSPAGPCLSQSHAAHLVSKSGLVLSLPLLRCHPGHCTWAPVSDSHVPMVLSREGDACQVFVVRSPLRHHCLQC